jgi:ferritin-like metal-binding protein YciE
MKSQIAMAPRGSYRDGLETHLRETRDHATRVQRRLGELGGQGSSPIQAGVGLVQSVVGQVLALGKTPLDLVRGRGGDEKVLKNAKDACATEALEIATYTAIERLASSVGDEATQALADSIRADEQKMLDRILREIPKLTEAVVRSEIRGTSSYDIGKTGAADAARSVSESVTGAARDATSSAKRAARQARKVPGVAQAEGQVKGALASEGDLAIAGYGKLTAAEIVEKLAHLSQIDLAKIDSYERKNENRTTILSRIASLRGDEPWPGYDELSVEEIGAVLDEGDEDRVKRVRSYERSHKNRSGVIDAAERELVKAEGLWSRSNRACVAQANRDCRVSGKSPGGCKRQRVAPGGNAAPCVGGPHESSGGRRSRLRSVPRRLAWRRRSRDAAVGRVARRGLGTSSAFASRSLRRVRASSRLRAWDRSSCAIAATRGPRRSSALARCASLSVGEESTSKLASTREAVTLACCPPGPEERLVRSVTSESGIASSPLIASRR